MICALIASLLLSARRTYPEFDFSDYAINDCRRIGRFSVKAHTRNGIIVSIHLVPFNWRNGEQELGYALAIASRE